MPHSTITAPALYQSHKKTTTLNRSTLGSERGETVAAALHRLGDFGHAAVAPGVGSASTSGKSQVYHGSKTNRRSFMLISETLRMATRKHTRVQGGILKKNTFFSIIQKHRDRVPSEHGGTPWGIAASLLHVHRVLLTVVALPAQQVTAAGGLSALQRGDSVIEGAAHRARRCEHEAEESAGSAGYFKDLSRLAAGRRQRARQPGVNSMACRTQKCRDYTTPGARQFNAWIYELASGRVRMMNWSKCFYPRDPSLSLPSVNRVGAYSTCNHWHRVVFPRL